jgi:hypothetical protein
MRLLALLSAIESIGTPENSLKVLHKPLMESLSAGFFKGVTVNLVELRYGRHEELRPLLPKLILAASVLQPPK